jgi:branched-chain amino acid transport system substrate-binding protein
MLKRVTVSIAWAGLLAIGVVACGGNAAPTAKLSPIVVGVMLDLTGSSGAQAGAGGQQGTEMAYAEINSHGGINGHPIQTVEEDSASTPDGGILAARKLVQQDSAFVIQSVSSSAALIPTLPFLESQGTPLIASASGSPSLLSPARKNVFGGAGVPQTTQVPAELDAVQKLLKPSTIALVTSTSEAFVVSEKKLLLAEYSKRGIRVVAQPTFAGTDTDFTAQVQAVKNSNPDAVNIVGLPPATARLLIQLHRAGVTVPMFGDPAAADDALINLAGADAEGFYAAYTSGVQYPSDNTAVMANFRTRFKKQFPNANAAAYPNFITIQAYADAYVLADALRRAGNNPTQASVIAALEQTTSFVAGQKSGQGSYWSGALPVGMPRSFSATDHQGSRNLVMLKVVNGHFVPSA